MHLTVCIVVNGKKLQSQTVDLGLDRTMPNVELIRGLFISYNIFEFQDHLFFEFWCLQTDRQTDRQTDNGDKYSILAVYVLNLPITKKIKYKPFFSRCF